MSRNFIVWKFSINFVFGHCSRDSGVETRWHGEKQRRKKKLSRCAVLTHIENIINYKIIYEKSSRSYSYSSYLVSRYESFIKSFKWLQCRLVAWKAFVGSVLSGIDRLWLVSGSLSAMEFFAHLVLCFNRIFNKKLFVSTITIYTIYGSIFAAVGVEEARKNGKKEVWVVTGSLVKYSESGWNGAAFLPSSLSTFCITIVKGNSRILEARKSICRQRRLELFNPFKSAIVPFMYEKNHSF